MPKTLIPYLVFGLLNLVACVIGNEDLRMITKPFLMPALMFFFYKTARLTTLNKFVYAALALAWAGDVLLIFSEEKANFFMLGLASFLMSHLVYILINISAVNEPGKGFKLQWQDLPFFLYGLIIFSALKDGLGAMYFPALAYTVVICIMALTARKRWKRTDNQSFWLVMAGALAFVISDSLLAVDKFQEPLPLSNFWIMGTYILAQFLIIRGIIVFIQKIPQSAGS